MAILPNFATWKCEFSGYVKKKNQWKEFFLPKILFKKHCSFWPIFSHVRPFYKGPFLKLSCLVEDNFNMTWLVVRQSSKIREKVQFQISVWLVVRLISTFFFGKILMYSLRPTVHCIVPSNCTFLWILTHYELASLVVTEKHNARENLIFLLKKSKINVYVHTLEWPTCQKSIEKNKKIVMSWVMVKLRLSVMLE